jgi:hypothetical protein
MLDWISSTGEGFDEVADGVVGDSVVIEFQM